MAGFLGIFKKHKFLESAQHNFLYTVMIKHCTDTELTHD